PSVTVCKYAAGRNDRWGCRGGSRRDLSGICRTGIRGWAGTVEASKLGAHPYDCSHLFCAVVFRPWPSDGAHAHVRDVLLYAVFPANRHRRDPGLDCDLFVEAACEAGLRGDGFLTRESAFA